VGGSDGIAELDGAADCISFNADGDGDGYKLDSAVGDSDGIAELDGAADCISFDGEEDGDGLAAVGCGVGGGVAGFRVGRFDGETVCGDTGTSVGSCGMTFGGRVLETIVSKSDVHSPR
jgi:hypothetical protein